MKTETNLTVIDPATNGRESFLENYNIELIKRMFRDEESCTHYMGTLYLLRDMVSSNIRIGEPGCDKHPQYPIWKLLNELVGALIRRDISPLDTVQKIRRN